MVPGTTAGAMADASQTHVCATLGGVVYSVTNKCAQITAPVPTMGPVLL